jgi:hypothetical protein
MLLLTAVLLAAAFGPAAQAGEDTNPDGSPMRFRFYRACLEDGFPCAPRILAQGRIDTNSADALRTFVQKARREQAGLPDELVVCFDSGRGDLPSAVRLGHMIRVLNLSTCVDTRYREAMMDAASGQLRYRTLADEPLCASVCVLAVAGGARRYVNPEARVAVRHFSELDESAPRISREMLESFLDSNNVDVTLLDIAAITPVNDARFLSQDDLTFYRIGTSGSQSSLVLGR